MATLSESRVTLRFFGENLDPEELSALLGTTPTDSYKKGQVRVTTSGSEFTYKKGMWRLEASDRKPANLAGQVSELLKVLPQSLELWRRLSSEYELDIFCGLFMEEGNEGFSLAPALMRDLATRGITIDFDLYAPTLEEPHSAQVPGDA